MVFELKHDILWMHFLACFIKRHGQYEAAVPLKWFLFWQVNNQSEPLTHWMSAAESNTFLFPDFDVIALPPQLVWSYNSTKHGSPSVCIACLCLTGEELCECKPERRGGYIMIFLEQGEEKSSFMGLRSTTLCFKYSRGFYLLCG